MLKQIEGSLGVAEAVALCRPEIICAYPISPQTHIVENLGAMVKKGSLEDCEFLNVESEFAAMSVAFVKGVGFVPRMLVWRWLLSGWTCFVLLAVAGWVKFLQ